MDGLHTFIPISLADLSVPAAAGIGAAALAVGIAVGYLVLGSLRGRSLAAAREEARRIEDKAKDEGRALVERARVDAEKLALEKRAALDAELEEGRKELREGERRLTKREDLLDKKLDTLTAKEEHLSRQQEQLKAQEALLAKRNEEVEGVLQQQKDRLLQVANMTVEQARQELLVRIEGDSRQEMATVVSKIVEEAQNEAKAKAQEITLMAVQRYATEHTPRRRRAVPIPSDA